jgi:hypothetical protein
MTFGRGSVLLCVLCGSVVKERVAAAEITTETQRFTEEDGEKQAS